MVDPWVAPDTQVPADPAPAPAAEPWAPSGRAASPTPAAPQAPTLPAPLQPLTAGDMVDGGLRAWKLAPGTMMAVAAVFTIPAQVLLGLLTRDTVDDVSISQTLSEAFSATGPDDVESGFGSDTFFVGLLVQGLALAFATGAVARIVTGWYTAHHVTFAEAVRASVGRAWALVAAWVLVHVVEGAFALVLFVPALVPMAWYSVVSVVVVCERTGPLRAMGRSYALVKRRFWPVVGVCSLVAAGDVVLSAALTALGAVYLEAELPAGWAVNTAVSAGSLLVTTPFVAGVVTLLYLDLRIRTEGLDIELRAREALP
jgi:hypothetical protein